jgi:hypothetical protein
MGETPDQIERHIYEKRSELGENINELQQKVKTAVDWRAQFDQRPMTMLGLAFGGGLLLSMFFGGRQNSHRFSSRWSRDRGRHESQLSPYGGSAKTQEWESKADSTWDNIRGAALAVVASRLGGLVEEVLPGFQEQYKRKRHERSSTTSRPNGPESAWRRTASGETDYMPQS